MAAMTLHYPHIFRIFSRTIIVILIVGIFSVFIIDPNSTHLFTTNHSQVKGAKTNDANLNLNQKVTVEELLNYLSVKPNDPYALSLLKKLSSNNSSKIEEEIKETEAIIKNRPDYAAAWFRLSILYSQIGREDLSKDALEHAKKLNLEF